MIEDGSASIVCWVAMGARAKVATVSFSFFRFLASEPTRIDLKTTSWVGGLWKSRLCIMIIIFPYRLGRISNSGESQQQGFLSVYSCVHFLRQSSQRERQAASKDGKEESAASVRSLDEMAKQCKRHYDNGTSGESSSPFAPSVADGLLAVLRMGYEKIPSRNTRVG